MEHQYDLLFLSPKEAYFLLQIHLQIKRD